MPSRLYEWASTTGKIREESALGARSPVRFRSTLAAPGATWPPAPGNDKPAGAKARRSCTGAKAAFAAGLSLDGLADGAEDARHLRAEEDQRDDRDDRDQGEDQRVLRETLALVLTSNKIDKSGKELHWAATSFLQRSPPPR